jgi:hypothetical protein
MPDKLIPLTIPAGIVRNGTKYQSKGTWYDAQLVRFVENTIKPMGGWRRIRKDDGVGLEPLGGLPRAAVAWRTDSGDTFVVIATTFALYCFAGGVLHDITPVGYVSGSEDTVPATTSGTYGAGAYGTGAYGVGASAPSYVDAALWQLDTFGNSLVGVPTSVKKLYVWDSDLGDLPEEVSGVDAPTSVTGVVVTPERFLVALGVNGNVRKLQWADQETTTGWDILQPGATTGDFELTTDGRLICGARTKGETLLWTDTDLHAMRYIGGTLIYQFVLLGEKCGIISPRAKATFDTKALWMGRRNFYGYDGYVQPIACPVHDYVFGDFNDLQAAKVWSMTIAEFGEVWWFYPSKTSNECDRYVIYNYREQHWNIGKLRRAAGIDAGALPYPLLVAPSGEVFEHELLPSISTRPAVDGEGGAFYILTEDGGVILLENGGGLMAEGHHPYIESGPVEVGDGDRLMNVQRLVPDEKTRGQVLVTFFGANYPTEAETQYGPYDMSNISNVRFKARQARIRLDENALVDWRVGVLRLGVRESDRR